MRKLSKEQIDTVNSLLLGFDTIARHIEENGNRIGLRAASAASAVKSLDMIADALESELFGPANLAARKAKVLQKDSDESYVATFDAPMAPHQVDGDEPYMGAFSDDQSAAVQQGKSSTGRPLA